MDCQIKLSFSNGEVQEFTGSAQVLTCGVIEVTYTDEVEAGFGLSGVKKSVTKGFRLGNSEGEVSSYEITK